MLAVMHYISVDEAAARAGYHPNHVRRLIRHEAIKADKKAGVWWIHEQDFDDYVARMVELGVEKYNPYRLEN